MTSPALDPAVHSGTAADVRRARRALIVVGLVVVTPAAGYIAPISAIMMGAPWASSAHTKCT